MPGSAGQLMAIRRSGSHGALADPDPLGDAGQGGVGEDELGDGVHRGGTIWSRPPDSVKVRASPAGELTGRSGRPGSKQLAAPLVRSMTRQANQQSTRRLAEQLDHAGRADHSD